MPKLDPTEQLLVGSLVGMLVMNAVILGALFAQAPPVPPAHFGPCIGAGAALNAAVIPLCLWRHWAGPSGALLTALVSVPNMGPQKVILVPDPLIHGPVILVGTLFIGCVVWAVVALWRRRSA